MTLNPPRQRLMLNNLPGKAISIQYLHKSVRIKLLHVVYSRTLPDAGHDHHSPDHGRNPCCVCYCLCPCFIEGVPVVADIIDVPGDSLAVFNAGYYIADNGLPRVSRSQRGGVGEEYLL